MSSSSSSESSPNDGRSSVRRETRSTRRAPGTGRRVGKGGQQNKKPRPPPEEKDSNNSSESEEVNSGPDEESNAEESDISDDEALKIKPLNERHRFLLQAIQILGIVPERHLMEMISEIGTRTKHPIRADDVSPEIIQVHLEAINASIGKLDCTIRKVICEVTGKVFYMYYITNETPVMLFQTSFTPYELELFQKIIQHILVKHNDFIASSNDLIGSAEGIDLETTKPKTEVEIEDVIKKFVKLKYLIKVSEGKNIDDGDCKLTLGVRTVKEMEPVLLDLYKKYLGNCCLCKLMLLHGFNCVKCQCSFHQHCFKTYTATATQCPNPLCKAKFPNFDDMPRRVSPVVEVQEEEEEGESQSGGANTSGSVASEMDTSG